MTAIPKITETAIRERVGERSFGLGRSYFEDDAVYDARREGVKLKARCSGSRADDYRVEATLGSMRIVSAKCSCPVGGGGRCKHVAAVLFAWIERPETFAESEEIDAVLQRLDKNTLVDLVRRMLDRYPDLELLLLPLAAKGATKGGGVDAGAIRAQATAVFRRAGDEWGVEREIGEAIDGIVEVGAAYAKRKNYASAAVVYETVMTVVLERLLDYEDENGDLLDAVSACADGLCACLKGEKSAVDREAILRALFAAVRADVEAGGRNLCGDAYEALLERTSADERRIVASWVRDALARPALGKWERESFGGMLLDFEAETMDDEAYLAACRETGRTYDLVSKLLELGRLGDAVTEAEAVGDYDLLGLADLFVERGHAKVAEGLLLERSETSTDTRLLEWLERRYEKRKDPSAALEMAARIFRAYPGFDRYKRVRSFAKKLGRWEALRPSLIARLEKSAYELVRVYLDERDLDRAIEIVNAGRYVLGLELDVAAACEKTRPRDAIAIYTHEAERRIAARGDYRPAVELLKKVRALYARLGEAATWDTYVAELRTRERRLRNLMKEFDAARM